MFDFAQLIAQQMQLETMTPTHHSLFVLGKAHAEKDEKEKTQDNFYEISLQYYYKVFYRSEIKMG